MIKKKILHLILLSFIVINVSQLVTFDDVSPIQALFHVHGGGGL